MARTWPSIRVDLIEGHGEQYWPRPGRIFAAARSHTFKQLAVRRHGLSLKSRSAVSSVTSICAFCRRPE